MSESQPELLFDLTPTEEQALMRETARRFASSRMREISRKADEAGETPDGFYEASAELGFTAVPIPEAFGGFGAARSPTGNVLIAEDLAYGDMSLAIGAMAPLSFVNTVIDHGTEAQKGKLLPPFADEAFRAATIALMEPGPRFDPNALASRASKQGDGYVLDGAKTMVPLGGSAEIMLVMANLEGEGPAAFVVPRGTAGVHAQREQYMGLRPLELCSVKLEGVKLPLDAKLGDGPFDYARFLDLSRIGIGALAVGVGHAILDYVKEYCNERIAFGEPITNRQAVAFMIANIAIELDGMRLMVYRAASRAEQALPFRREATLARIQSSRQAVQIGTDGVQLLGGHGFIREHMVELWYRNMNAIGILEGCVVV